MRKSVNEKALSISFLDENLRDAIENEEGMARIHALRLGYGRLGISLEPRDAPPQPPASTSATYNWIFQQRQEKVGEDIRQPAVIGGKAQPQLLPPRDRNEEILIEIADELSD